MAQSTENERSLEQKPIREGTEGRLTGRLLLRHAPPCFTGASGGVAGGFDEDEAE